MSDNHNYDIKLINSYIVLFKKVLNQVKSKNILNEEHYNYYIETLNNLKNKKEIIDDLIIILTEFKELCLNKNCGINLNLLEKLITLSGNTTDLLNFNKNNKKFLNKISDEINHLEKSIGNEDIISIIKEIRNLLNNKIKRIQQNSLKKDFEIRDLKLKVYALYKLLQNKNTNIKLTKSQETLLTNEVSSLRNIIKKIKIKNIGENNSTQIINLNSLFTSLKNNSSFQSILTNFKKINLSKSIIQKMDENELQKYISKIENLLKKNNQKNKLKPFNNNNFINGGVKQSQTIPSKISLNISNISNISNNKEINFIKNFYTFIKNLTNKAFIIKLSSLSPDEINKLFLENNSLSFSNNSIIYQNKDILETLSKFLFINITPLMNDMFSNYDLNNSENTINVVPKSNSFLRVLRAEYFNTNELKNIYKDTINMTTLNKKYASNISSKMSYNNSKGTSQVKQLQVKPSPTSSTISSLTNNETESETNKFSSSHKIIYINIFKFIDILYNVISQNSKIDYFYKNIFPTYAINIIVYNFFNTNLISKNNDNNNLLNVINIVNKNITFKSLLDKLYLEKSSNNIITYLRIRCDKTNNELNHYNKRFDIKINNNNTLMDILYNNHDFPYYLLENNVVKINPSLSNYNQYFTNETILTAFSPKKYDFKYKIGPFNNIFPPKNNNNIVSNNDISLRLNEITENLRDLKPVFVIGYGASGSGKTSSLIYFNKGVGDEKNGVLLSLCNQFAKSDGYTGIIVNSYELYSNPNTPQNSFIKENIIKKEINATLNNEKTNTLYFYFYNNSFVLNNKNEVSLIY